MKKIVISGATGMIGSALARCAIKNGLDVLCIIRKETSRIENLPDSVKIQYANLVDYKDLIIPGEYDVFYHFAWDKTSGHLRDDTDIQLNNIQYTLDAVHLAKRLACKKFIGAGSQAEYGIASEPLRPDTPVNPQSGYGIAKYSAGKFSKLLCSQMDLAYNWVRILSIFGPFDAPHTLIMYLLNELKAGRSPELTKCEQIWDYLYCDDAAKAFLAVGYNGINGKVYPLGSGNPRILSKYIESLRNIVNPASTLQFNKKNYYPHQPMYLNADISELIKDTGWKPEISFEEGIRTWMSSNHY